MSATIRAGGLTSDEPADTAESYIPFNCSMRMLA